MKEKMRKPVKRIFATTLLTLVLLGLWVAYNTYHVWRDYLARPQVAFRENGDIALGIYPEGRRSASVLTNDDFCAIMPVEPVENLRKMLKGLEVRGTFFVIPSYRRTDISPGQPQAEMLRRLDADGHEIAQHGLLHRAEKNKDRGAKMGAEMLFLTKEEQTKRLKRGMEILSAAGFPPRGHRSPSFSGTEETFRALEDLGFLYGSDVNLPPTNARALFFKGFKGRILYPYHPDGMELLEFTAHPDPSLEGEEAWKIFRRVQGRGGVFVITTHLPQIADPENLARLEAFLRELKKEDTWLCRMDELSEWWRAREKLAVETAREGDTLVVAYENPTPFPLKGAAFSLKKDDPDLKRYRIVDAGERVIAEGEIPDSGLVIVTLPPGEG